MRAVVVDDERLSREKVRQLLQSHSDVEVLAYCSNAKAALAIIIAQEPDLIFLDIQMPEMTGLEMLDELYKHAEINLPQIIFITAYDEHAIAAFDMNAVDYLLKPMKADRFDLALARCKERVENEEFTDPKRQELFNKYKESLKSKFVSATHLGKVYPLQVDEIIWAKSEGNYVRIFTKERFYMKRATLSELESTLNSRDILRIHKSHLVNINAITHFESSSHSDLMITLESGEQIKCSRNFSDQLKKILG